jgi:hypothetical protein
MAGLSENRQVANDEKLLGLFEPNIHVMVRCKAGKEVEFGNRDNSSLSFHSIGLVSSATLKRY